MNRLASIEIFVAVVESGSFAAAAEKLGIVRSVASRRVKWLEEELQARLLHRTTRSVALTPAGLQFYRKVREGLGSIRDAEMELHAKRDEATGKLVAGVPMSFGLMHVLPALASFRLSHPNIELEIVFDDAKSDLVKSGIDVSLRISELADSSMVARRLATIRHAVVASPAYLAARGIPLEPPDLGKHDCLVYTMKPQPQRWQFTRADTESVVSVRGGISANNSLAIREILLAGMGISLVPIYLVDQDLRSGALKEVLADWKASDLALSVIYPTRQHVPSTVRAFIAFVEKIVEHSSFSN